MEAMNFLKLGLTDERFFQHAKPDAHFPIIKQFTSYFHR